MFVEVIRMHMDQLANNNTGWLAGLRDPLVGRVLTLLHGRRSHAWTLEELALEAAALRSALADRFTQIVGCPPIRAEKIARRARALDPEHSGAIHVIAHVMEMQGRVHDGLAFLAAVESAWGESTGLSIHLAWHRALFHLDAGDLKSALAIYDRQIATTDSVDTSALADGSALLWRLYLQNIEVSDRWRPLADRWATHNLADARPFYVVHAMMAFAAAGRTAAALRLLEALPSIDIKLASSLIPEDALAAPLCEALLAFARSDYAECVEWLTHVRHIAHRCGGSLAQCDLIHLTFTEAASRARRARLGHALVVQRIARKPASRFNRLLERRLGTRPGYQERRAKAASHKR
jgi:AraC-like DNA-binding protein